MSKRSQRRWIRTRVAKAGLAAPMMEALEARQLLATISWDGGPSGTGTGWSDPTNWAGDVLPGPGDDALISVAANPVIQITGVVAVRSVASSEALSISGSLTVTDASLFSAAVTLTGTLAGTGDCTFAAPLTWSGGVMAGPATTGGAVGRTIINALGSLQIDGTTHDLNRVLENNGTVTWLAGPLRMAAGTLNNNNSFTANTSGSLQSFGSSGTGVNAFNNIGTFTKLGTGEVAFSVLAAGVAFNSLGTVSLQAGMLTLGGGGTMSTPLTVSPGAAFTLGDTYTFTGSGSINGSGTVNFTGGTHSLPAGRFNPTGIVNFTGGTITISTPFTPSGVGPIGANVTFSAAMNYSGPLTITGTASFGVAQTFSSLTLSGTLTGGGDVTISGVLDWLGGTMSGAGKTNVSASGSLTIESVAAHVLSRTLNSGGPATWTGGDLAFAAGTLNNNGTFTANSGAGTLLSYGNSGTNSFVSNGTFTKLGTGEVRFTTNVTGVGFNNVGTVGVVVGQLTLGGGGAASAAFNVSAGGTLSFAANYSFSASGSIAGSGVVSFNGGTQSIPAGLFNPTGIVNFSAGTVTINNTFTPTSLGPIGATVNFAATLGYSAPITVNGSASFALPQTFSGLTLNGILMGTGDVTVTGALVWNSGSMTGAGKTLLPAGSTLSIATGATHTLGRQITSNGDSTWTGGAIAMNGGTFNNNGTLTINAPTTLQCYGAGGTNAINNAGVFIKQGVGDAIIFAAPSAMPLTNTGSLTVLAGNLSLGGGSTSTGLIVEAGGTLTFSTSFTYNLGGGVQGAGTVNFNGGTHTFAAGQFSPTGPLNFNGGTVTINNTFSTTQLGPVAGTVFLNATVTFSNVTLSGTMAGSGDVFITGAFNWLGGTLTGTGRTTLNPGSSLTISTNAHSLGRRLDVGSGASWIGGDIAFSGGTLNILSGTTFTINSNAAVQATGSSGTNVFSNAGTIVKLGIGDAQFAPGSFGVSLNNSGSITVQEGSLSIGGGTTGGTIAVPLNGSLNLLGTYAYTGGSISGAGQITFSAGTHVMTLANFNPSGFVNFTGGTVTIGNTISPAALGTISGSVIFNATLNYLGAMTISGSATFNAVESLGSITLTGTLAGSADISVFGTLTWSGGTMSGTGRTLVPVGSTLIINGVAHTLSRLLDVSAPATWTDGDIAFADGSLAVRAASVLTLNPTTTVTATGSSGTNTLINQGSIVKIGAGTARLAAGATAVALNNSNQVTVQAGTLDISGGGGNTGQMLSQASATLSFGATLAWTGGSIIGAGTVAFTAGTHSIIATQFSPVGPVNFSGGTVTIGNSFAPSALGTIGATVIFNALVSYTGDLAISGSASFAAPQSFGSLSLSGTLTGAGAITVRTGLTWTGGAMTGGGATVLALGSVSTVSGTSHSLSRVLDVSGAVTWTAGDLVFTGGTLNIAAGASLTADLAATTSVSGTSGVSAVNNSGTFNKLGAGTLQFTTGAPGVALNNFGAATVQVGTLSIGGGGTTQGPITINLSGALVLAASYTYSGAGSVVGTGSVSFTGGTHSIGPGQIGVTGAVNFTGGTITVNGTFSPTALGPIGANVTFLSTLNYSGSLTISGTATFNGAQSFSGMTLTGTLAGSGNVSVTGTLNWTAGTMSGAGQTIVPVGGTLSLTGGARTLGRSLALGGASSWTAGDINLAGGNLTIMDTGAMTVNTTATLTIAGISGSNAFVDKGQLIKFGTGALTIASTGTGVWFTNSGLVSVQVGTINLGPSVTNYANNTFSGGSWIIESVGILAFPAGTLIYTSNATVRMNGVNSSFTAFATLTVNQGSLTLADGRLATFSPVGNVFTNTGSLVKAGTGTATFASNLTFSNTGSVSVTGGTLAILGPVSQISGSTLTGGSWNVSGGGVLSIPGAAIVSSNAVISISGATSAFDAVNGLHSNTGSFTVSGGRNFAATTFTNAGKLTIGTGSTLTVTGAFNNSFYTMIRGGTIVASGGGDSSGYFWFFNSGLLSLSGTHTFGAAASVSGSGAMNITGGSSTFSCPVKLTGLLTLAAGSVSLDQGGIFGGVSNSGTLNLGSQTLTVSGIYSQAVSGVLNVRMDSDTQFGRIVAGGATTIAGTLNVTWGVGYVPAPGITFDFITGSSRTGTFGSTNLATLSGRLLQLSYGNSGVTLVVSSGFTGTRHLETF